MVRAVQLGCSPKNLVDPTFVLKPPQLCCVTVCPVKAVPASEGSLTVHDRAALISTRFISALFTPYKS